MAKNGNIIMDATAAVISPNICDPSNRKYLEAKRIQMKRFFKLWFESTRIMKSAEYQTNNKCSSFKGNTTDLNKAIHSLITDPPVPGCKLKHSKQLKSHLLFGWEIYKFLVSWRTLGGVDEQNTEGVHLWFNELVQIFGNTRVGFRQQLVMD